MTNIPKKTKNRTPFSGFNREKFAILEVLYEQKMKNMENNYLFPEEILERMYDKLGFPSIIKRGHTVGTIRTTLCRLHKFKNHSANSYLLRTKDKHNGRKKFKYSISKNGERLFKEMRDRGLTAPYRRAIKSRARRIMEYSMYRPEEFEDPYQSPW